MPEDMPNLDSEQEGVAPQPAGLLPPESRRPPEDVAPPDDPVPVTPIQVSDEKMKQFAAIMRSQGIRDADTALAQSYLTGDIHQYLNRPGEAYFSSSHEPIPVRDEGVLTSAPPGQIAATFSSVVPKVMLDPSDFVGHIHGAGIANFGDPLNTSTVKQEPGPADWILPQRNGVAYYADHHGLIRMNFEPDKGFSYDVVALPRGQKTYGNQSGGDHISLDGISNTVTAA